MCKEIFNNKKYRVENVSEECGYRILRRNFGDEREETIYYTFNNIDTHELHHYDPEAINVLDIMMGRLIGIQIVYDYGK